MSLDNPFAGRILTEEEQPKTVAMQLTTLSEKRRIEEMNNEIAGELELPETNVWRPIWLKDGWEQVDPLDMDFIEEHAISVFWNEDTFYWKLPYGCIPPNQKRFRHLSDTFDPYEAEQKNKRYTQNRI